MSARREDTSVRAKLDGRALERYYENLDRDVVVIDASADYETLVVPNGNSKEPVHRWFHVKEAYSHRLLNQVVKDCSLAQSGQLSLVDPFSGSGTTAVSLAQLVEHGYLSSGTFSAFEVNPFLAALTRAKVSAYQTPNFDFLPTAKQVAARALRPNAQASRVPKLSTFHNRDYFSSDSLDTLLKLRQAIDRLECDGSSAGTVELTRVCLAAITERCSSLRRDGRALRYEPKKPVSEPVEAFLDLAHVIDEDMCPTALELAGEVYEGDSKLCLASESTGDLSLFSPPYPNNIDYTEVYKMENWIGGWIDSHEGFSAQRRRTLRSHPSLKFDDSASPELENLQPGIEELLEPMLRAIPENRYSHATARLIKGYFFDMALVFLRLSENLRTGATIACVVGNSLHGRSESNYFLVAADTILAQVARLAGLEVESITVARRPVRRMSALTHLRESVVYCRVDNPKTASSKGTS